MFETWNDNLGGLGAYAPSYPGDPGRGVDLGGRLIGKGGVILPPPPANCDADYRAKYIRVFGVDPMCTPYVAPPPTLYVPPVTGPGTNNPGPIVETPPYIAPYRNPVPVPIEPATPGIPTSPPVVMPRGRRPHPHSRPAPTTRPVRQTRPGEMCPSYGHYNRPIPGVDEYQVIACTPGQPLPRVNRGLQRVVRQEALARHPGGGHEQVGRAGDYQGGGYAPAGSGMSTDSTGSIGGSTAGQICLSPMVLIGGIAVLFFMMKR